MRAAVVVAACMWLASAVPSVLTYVPFDRWVD